MSTNPSDLLWYQQAANAATILGAIGYGVHIAVAYRCLSEISRIRSPQNTKWLAFVAALFLLGTSNISCSLHFNQLAFIDKSDYPNGPAAFLSEQQSDPSNVGAVATSIIMMVLVGMFMIYRIHSLWKRPIVSGVLCLVLIAAIVMSALHAIQLTKPENVTFLSNSSVVQFSVPYVSLATALNIIITLILVPRLLELRRQLYYTGIDESQKFTSIEALVTESAFPLGLISLVFIVLFGFQKVSSILFLPLMVQIMAIMPELIILRIVQGHGWSVDVIRRLRPSSLARSGNFEGTNNPQDVSLNEMESPDRSIVKSDRFV